MSPLTPEQRAREQIDALLRAAGWVIQDMAELNRNAAEGVAAREFPMAGGPCDYLLFVGGKACGVIGAEIVESLQAALEAFQSVADELAKPVHLEP
jgi:type I restriction enzyme R subunit